VNQCDIDIDFDPRTDTPAGKDPDSFSATHRRAHRLLWGRPLPDGRPFPLRDSKPARYLEHESDLGKFVLSSDGGIPTFSNHRRAPAYLQEISLEQRDEFSRRTWTIGGSIVFPANRVGTAMTINGARGWNRQIRDRFDLTMECIRRYYVKQPSPLSEVLDRYRTYFGLFGDFHGFVSHFLLQDIVTDDCTAVRFFIPFDGFASSPIPGTIDIYREYREAALRFIRLRGARMVTIRMEALARSGTAGA
jgi:hypothetical protein